MPATQRRVYVKQTVKLVSILKSLSCQFIRLTNAIIFSLISNCRKANWIKFTFFYNCFTWWPKPTCLQSSVHKVYDCIKRTPGYSIKKSIPIRTFIPILFQIRLKICDSLKIYRDRATPSIFGDLRKSIVCNSSKGVDFSFPIPLSETKGLLHIDKER